MVCGLLWFPVWPEKFDRKAVDCSPLWSCCISGGPFPVVVVEDDNCGLWFPVV